MKVEQVKKHPPEVFYEKDVLKNFATRTVKHLCQSLFFDKVAGLRDATLLKKETATNFRSMIFII